MLRKALGITGLLALGLSVRLCAAQASGLMLADDTRMPRVSVTWERADGTRTVLSAALPYTSPEDRVEMGANLESFVALGGSRLEKGAGRPSGAIVRVGLVKTDSDLLMFEDIANGSDVVVELTGVYFNQPGTPDPQTLIQRLRYKADDVVACGLAINQAEMFNVVSPDDDMGGTILPEQTRFASLGGGEPGSGQSRVGVGEDGAIAMRVVIPYRLLRHKGDPWSLEVPGSFFEPVQFDLEFEVLPAEMAAAEGVEASGLGT